MEIFSELKKQAEEVRFKYIQKGNPNRRKLIGNVAIGKLEISNGNIYQQEATSKKEPMDRPVEKPEALTGKGGKPYTGPKQYFAPYPDEDHPDQPLNDTHAEYKVFNALADILESAGLPEETEGILYLYTEREMCSGCTQVSLDFQTFFNRKFNNIELKVQWTRKYRKRDDS